MSELTNTQYASLFTQMAKEMGVTPDKVAESFARHQERGEIILSLPRDPIAQAQQALPILGRALEGKLARAWNWLMMMPSTSNFGLWSARISATLSINVYNARREKSCLPG